MPEKLHLDTLSLEDAIMKVSSELQVVASLDIRKVENASRMVRLTGRLTELLGTFTSAIKVDTRGKPRYHRASPAVGPEVGNVVYIHGGGRNRPVSGKQLRKRR